MDYTAIAGMIITGLASISAVSISIGKVLPVITKYVKIAKDAVETLSDVADALKPDADGKINITPDEIAKITADVNAFRIALATKAV